MNIFVTGGTGYLGSAMIQLLHLEAEVETIYVLHRSTTKFNHLVQCLGDQKNKIVGIKGSLENFVFDFDGVDAVIHAGAVRNIKYCKEHPSKVFDVNIKGTLRLLDISMVGDVQKFIYISSQSVYGNIIGERVNEDFPTNPTSVYAKSKLTGELLTSLHDSKMKWTILRPTRLIGASPFINEDSFLTSIYPQNCLDEKSLKIYGDGNQRINLIDVNDCAAAVWKLIKGSDELWNTVYNMSSDYRVTINVIAGYYLQWCQSNSLINQIEHVESNASNDFIDIDNSKLKEAINWEIRTNRDSVIELMEMMKENRSSKPVSGE